MSAHKWKIGDWAVGEHSKKRWLIISCGDGDVGVGVSREDGYAATGISLSHLRHLPGCDSWDWKPTPPAPKYRPFANAAEFKPHRDKWIVRKDGKPGAHRSGTYGDSGSIFSFEHMFDSFMFEDGTPCGVLETSE